MKDIKLSIIIPAYNVEAYIEKCMESILNQNSEEIEIILVNDGSKDSTGELCDLYKSRYSNVIVFHKENSGQSDSRNLAINNAKGKYLMFIDSDDYILSDSISQIVKMLDNDEEIDVLIGSKYVSYDYKSKQIVQDGICFEKGEIEILHGEKLLDKLLSKGTFDYYPWLNIVRKDYLVRNGFFFKSGAFFEDAMWVPELLINAKKIGYIDFAFYVYVRNREGATTTLINEKVYQDKMKVCEYTANFIEEYKLNKSTKEKVLGNTNRIYVSLLADCWYFDKEKRNGYISIIKKYKDIMLYSKRKYLQILYYMQKILGLKVVSFVLYLRAKHVRSKYS